MLRDAYGLAVSTAAPAAVAGIDRFAAEVLSHGQGAAAILDAAAADPGCVLANALCGALYLFLQTADGVRRAAPWLDRARRAAQAGRLTEREQRWLAALDAWAHGDARRALAVHQAIAERWPEDLLNAKLAQVHLINLGDRGAMRALAERVLPVHRDRSHAWGLLAFALEQVGDLDGALGAGERAVALSDAACRAGADRCAADPWAEHAVAHVLEARGAAAEGLAWLAPRAPGWGRCSSFMLTHQWWHVALFELASDRADRALALFDERVWGVRKAYVQDQVNAVSLLARLERHGVDVGRRWLDVAAHVRPRIFDRQNAFFDLHFGYALARAGEDVAVLKLLGGIADHARRDENDVAAVWRDVALPAARGVVAYARGQLASAAAWLAPLAGRLHLLGGSTAQQAWFEAMRSDAVVGAARGAAQARAWTRGAPAPIGLAAA